jgi:hypothetical protein
MLQIRRVSLGIALLLLGCAGSLTPALALPPEEDIPEEVLRTEIITEARSPVDGTPLTAAEYAELQAELEAGPDTRPQLSPQVENIITLLYIRRAIRSVFPFLLN